MTKAAVFLAIPPKFDSLPSRLLGFPHSKKGEYYEFWGFDKIGL